MILYPEDFDKTPVELQYDLQCFCPKCDKPHLDKNGFLYNPGYFKLCDDCFHKLVIELSDRIAGCIFRRDKYDSDRSTDNSEET